MGLQPSWRWWPWLWDSEVVALQKPQKSRRFRKCKDQMCSGALESRGFAASWCRGSGCQPGRALEPMTDRAPPRRKTPPRGESARPRGIASGSGRLAARDTRRHLGVVAFLMEVVGAVERE